MRRSPESRAWSFRQGLEDPPLHLAYLTALIPATLKPSPVRPESRRWSACSPRPLLPLPVPSDCALRQPLQYPLIVSFSFQSGACRRAWMLADSPKGLRKALEDPAVKPYPCWYGKKPTPVWIPSGQRITLLLIILILVFASWSLLENHHRRRVGIGNEGICRSRAFDRVRIVRWRSPMPPGGRSRYSTTSLRLTSHTHDPRAILILASQAVRHRCQGTNPTLLSPVQNRRPLFRRPQPRNFLASTRPRRKEPSTPHLQ